MRKVIFGGANSLDNFLARADHAVDWLMWSDEVSALIADFWQKIDAVLMGRKTYEAAAGHGQETGYAGVANYVFSRSWTRPVPPGLTVVREHAATFVRDLKEQPGKDICLMGGGDLARTLFEADLIDEIGLNVHPVLLGSGVPLFHTMSRQIDLELQECRPLKNGCVYLLYRVKHRTGQP